MEYNQILNRMFRSFNFFIVLCVLVIFPNGLFNYIKPELRILKIVVELGLYSLIFINLILRSPLTGIFKFVLTNGLIILVAFELSKFFTYLLIGNSKYFENFLISLLLSFTVILIGTLLIAIIGKIVKNVC